jgi:hypothetical protein
MTTAARYGMVPADSEAGSPSDTEPPRPRGGPYPQARPSDLVLIGQGRHRLVPAARDGFLVWQSAFGATIWITDSWRSPAQQAECKRKKPTLCATPEKSWHVKGRAVDVNLGKVGIGNDRSELYARLKATAYAAGWCRSNPVEPWHFSFGGCG